MKLTRQNALKFALFVCIFSLGSNKIADFDIWYHIKTGEYILAHFAIPHHDIFSYSTKEPWVAHEWLSQVILHLAYKTGGFRLIILFRALILCLTFGLLFRIVSRRAQTVTHQIFSVALAIIVSAGSFLERPQLFSYLLFLFLYEQLILYGENKKNALWHFIPLFILWVNLHSSFILGLFLILFFMVNESMKAVMHNEKSSKARHLCCLLLLCSLSSLINPNHVKMFLYPFETLLNKQHMDLILEWQSPDFHIIQMQFAELFIFLTIAGIAAARSRVKGIELFLLFFFLHFALYSRRNLPFFAFVCAPVLASSLSDLMKAFEDAASKIPVLRSFYALDKKAAVEIPALNALIFIFLFIFLATRVPRSNALDKTVYVKDFPVKAAEYLKSHPRPGNLFNEYDWGGYLIFALYPQYKVFIDGRMDIHMKTTIPDYLKIMHYEKGWEAVVKKHNMRLFLLRRDNILTRILRRDKNFRVLYEDKTSILFARGQGEDVQEKFPKLIPFRKEGRWGYCDRNKKVIIPLIYRLAEPFHAGLAEVCGGGCGIIDTKGKIIVPLKYDMVDKFSEGYVTVKLVDSTFGFKVYPSFNDYGFVDKYGRECKPFPLKKYDYIWPFSHKRALVNAKNKYGFIDTKAREVIPVIYDDAKSFSEGLASVKLNGKCGFIDVQGRETIPLTYDYTGSFSEELAMVCIREDGYLNCGFINKEGRKITSLKYGWPSTGFHEGLALVSVVGGYCFIDKTGREIICMSYNNVNPVKEGFAVVRRFDEKLGGILSGYIDIKGREIVPPKYYSVEDFNEGRALVNYKKKYGFVDKRGNEIIPLKYDDARSFQQERAAIKLKDRWGFIDKNGKAITPFVYEYVSDFSDGIARVHRNSKAYGYIDRNGIEYFEEDKEKQKVVSLNR